MHLGLWTRLDLMPSLIRLSRFQSAPGEVHFKALQNVVLFVRENHERCLMYRRSPATLARLRVNLEGHTTEVSSIMAEFTITGSVAAVIDSAIVMSSEPEGRTLNFPSVNMPYVASLLGSSQSKHVPRTIQTTKSTSPIIGVGPPLTEGFVDAGFGSIYETVGLVQLSLCQALLSGGYARNKPLWHTALLNPSSMLLLRFRSLSNGFEC